MQTVIKKNPVDKYLAKCVARLIIAGRNLRDRMRGDDIPQTYLAISLVRASMEYFQDATKAAPESLGNATAAAYGVSLLCENDRLCDEASKEIRSRFVVIPGGNT